MSEEVVAPEVATPESQAPAETVPSEPAAGQTTNYSSLIKEDGSFSDEFYSSLPDDLGSHSSIKQMKSVTDLAKSYVNTKGLVGKKLEEFWTSEDPAIAAKRKEIMGVPDSADGYELQIPEVPEGVAYNETVVNDFKAKAAELGITQEQAKALVEWDASRATQAFEGITENIEAQTAQAEASLKSEWGTKFDYNVSKVQQATDHLGITEKVNELGLGREPEFLKMVLEKLVPAISDDKLVESAQKDTLATISDSLDDIESKIYKYEGTTRDPEYLKLIKERSELLKKVS